MRFVSDNMHTMTKRFQFDDAMFGHSDLITVFFCTSFCMFSAYLACLAVSSSAFVGHFCELSLLLLSLVVLIKFLFDTLSAPSSK